MQESPRRAGVGNQDSSAALEELLRSANPIVPITPHLVALLTFMLSHSLSYIHPGDCILLEEEENHCIDNDSATKVTELPADLTASLLRMQVRTHLFSEANPASPPSPRHLISKVRFKKHHFAN